jgi:hypothetical protein
MGENRRSGKLASTLTHDGLLLNEHLFQRNDRIEIQIMGSWIAGSFQQDRHGYYLLTPNHAGIRLRPGLTARSNHTISRLEKGPN